MGKINQWPTSTGKPNTAEAQKRNIKIEGVGQEDATKYWKSIFAALESPDTDAIVVESLSGNGFTHSARKISPPATPIYINAHSGYTSLNSQIDELQTGQVVFLDESMDLRGVKETDDENDIQFIKKFCAIVKEKKLKVILHARLSMESKDSLSALRSEGLRIPEQPVEFGARQEDMYAIAKELLKQRGIDDQELAGGIADICVVPGEISMVVDICANSGLRDQKEIEKRYSREFQPHKNARNPGRLGKELFLFLSNIVTGEKEVAVASLNEKEKMLFEKAERFNLVSIQYGADGKIIKVKTPDAYKAII